MSEHNVIRERLDRIRELVLPDAKVKGKPCHVCGYRRPPEVTCPLCRGRQVAAENLLRAVRTISAEVRL